MGKIIANTMPKGRNVDNSVLIFYGKDFYLTVRLSKRIITNHLY
jgi:hypothetical protein